jgi:Development and cell death domain
LPPSARCDNTTESECLQKQLVGTTQSNALWSMNIKPGDDIYLFNFNTGLVRGPYSATSGTDSHEPTAWGGKFPVQVRISKTLLTKQGYNSAASSPPILARKRPSGELGKDAGQIFTWLQEFGTQLEFQPATHP